MKSKESTGICLLVRKNNEINVLLIKKIYTYAFCDIVLGKYKRVTDRPLNQLLNETTLLEKKLLSTLQFDRIYDHAFRLSDFNNRMFLESKKIFNENIINDPFFLQRLANSKSVKLKYSIPGGRLESNESHIDCAIRELYEETNIKSREIKIYPTFKKVKKIVDNNIQYTYHYYLATSKNILNPRTDLFNRDQMMEISEIDFVSMKQLNILDKDLHKFVLPFVNYSKKNKLI